MREVVLSQDWAPKVGGAHLWLHEVYRRWPSRVSVLTTPCGGAEDSAGIIRALPEIDEIDLLNARCLRMLWRQVLEVKRLAPGRIHALRAFPEGFVGWLYTRFRRSRLITYAHGEEILVARSSRQLKRIATRVYAGSDLVIANSENTRELLLQLCPSARVVCIHPGVDVEAFSRTRDEIARYRAQFGLPEGTVIVSTLARMEPRKNHAAVMRAVAETPGTAYLCGSDGMENGALRELARELGITDRVRFIGNVPEREKALVYLASDIHAMPSIRVRSMIEGFGIVFLEAAACGIPSICGNNGGQAEAVLDGKTGVAVDGTRQEDVTAAVGRLAGNRPLRESLGAQGRQWAAQHDWSCVARRVIASSQPIRRPPDGSSR